MRLHSVCLSSLLVSLVGAASYGGAACTITPNDATSDAGTGGTDGSTSGDGGPGADGATGDGGTGLLGFTPSNLDLSRLDFTDVGDAVESTSRTFETSVGNLLGSDNAATSHYTEITEPNGFKLGVFTVKSLTIQAGVTISVVGADALVIVALDKIDIQGTLLGSSQFSPSSRLGPGAVTDDARNNIMGPGAGGGGAGTGETAAGGGGFCGVGGTGSSLTGAAAAGGVSYGTPALIPLVAGSNGGSGAVGAGGAGGGAIQLVARSSISVSGVIHVGGEGGGNGGVYNPPTSQESSGGGSGGALLLEAPVVTVSGTLAANGAGGGQGDGARGRDSTADATAAAGGNDGTHGSPGGAGGAAANIDGKTGSVDPGATAGGGGGAVGRIRINTKTGHAALSGTISPATSTACSTEGTLAP